MKQRSLNICLALVFLFCLAFFFSPVHSLNASTGYINYDLSKQEDPNAIAILSQNLLREGCFKCHSDMYPDKAYDPQAYDPNIHNYSCFMSLENAPYPLFYSTYDPDNALPGTNLSSEYLEKFRRDYKKRKKGHLTHLVYQPFGLGRTCLDCHDPNHYKLADLADPNGHDNGKKEFIIYFKGHNNLKKTTLTNTKVCYECHGGFYPKGSEALPDDPNIDPSSVRLLQWGDPGSVTCLQCHDDSYENGGIYASYVSRYCSFPNWHYKDPNGCQCYPNFHHDDPNGCLIKAPDPDKIRKQNYWPKSGHGVTEQKKYAGATIDTGYSNPNRAAQTYPNKGAMNNENIPITNDPNDPNPHSRDHDIDLDPNDGEKNFCWECHWSNKIVREKVCVETLQASDYPDGFSIGKYNGHLDTTKYRDERWGPVERAYPEVCGGHKQWDLCRDCHPTKYSHFIYEELGSGVRRKPGPIDRSSHCITCHNPHGSGDDQGNINVFMIKRRIYKSMCNNCHYSQFKYDPNMEDCDLFALQHADPNKDTWVVDFFDPLKQDVIESDSSENSISIPAGTKDICEVCHQDKPREDWPNPGEESGDAVFDYKHRNGSRHYFNPDPNSAECSDPNNCTIDYRGTDCTGCHIHDPGPAPHPDDPDYDYETGDSRSVFNSKAFAPTCRCHGIGRIDISRLEYDPDEYKGKVPLPDIAGKGHGIPPPPFPPQKTNLPEKHKDPNQDLHMAHLQYNFPCFRCHIDPDNLPYDPNNQYIFELDGNIQIGFDQLLNPDGIYEESTKRCFNLYCHSNTKGGYAELIAWSDTYKFCRDTNDISCIDTNDLHFTYCDNCHKTPPDPNITIPPDPNVTDHSNCLTSCETCHPHNGIYEGKPGFYQHVNGIVDVEEIINTFEDTGCGCCHPSSDPNLQWHNPYSFLPGTCQKCHEDHTKFVYCAGSSTEVDARCLDCHQDILKNLKPDFGCDTDKKWLHNASAECTSCHSAVCDPGTIYHYEYKGTLPLSIEQNWNNDKGCGECHKDMESPFDSKVELHGKVKTDCRDCHGRHCEMNIVQSFRKDITNTCGACHDDPKISDGSTLHKPVLDMPCSDCHGEHETISGLRGYLGDPVKCGYCHGNPPIMNIVVNGVSISKTHPPEATDCEACHPGVRNARKHYKDAGPMNLVQSWEGLNSCGICHSDPLVLGCDRVPSSIHARLGPGNECSFCHTNHTDMFYWDIPAKCIACHGTNPAICDICGPGDISTHYAFDTFGINQAGIQDCLFCHVGPSGGGEANPINHINDPMTYVNPLTCLGCHTVVVPHGGAGLPWEGGLWPTVNCYSCHPTHCVSTFSNNQACIWCHTAAPPLQNVCGKPGLAPHTGDCINCHAAGAPTGGECNPADHMNGLTYVRNGTCILCHTEIIPTHGPGTETCSACHPVHCGFTYCSEPQCKTCHNFLNIPGFKDYKIDGSFPISSDYGCVSQEVIKHEPTAYRECNRCHMGECNPQVHKINNYDIDPFINPDCTMTDLSGMRLSFSDCKLCHLNPEMERLHSNCTSKPCKDCHYPGISNTCLINNHLCILDYRGNEKCRCCHTSPDIDPAQCEDNNEKPTGEHSPEVFSSNCEDCHTEEYLPENHANGFSDLTNMFTRGEKCIRCHNDQRFREIHKHIDINNNKLCEECHESGTNRPGDYHLCNTLYCDDSKCIICHLEDMLKDPDYITIDKCEDKNGNRLIGPHPVGERVCKKCHGGECYAGMHMDGNTDVSTMTDMTLAVTSCGLCHNDPNFRNSHEKCQKECGICHTGVTNHKCNYDFDYCKNEDCKCCHIGPGFDIKSDYGCTLDLLEHEPDAYNDCIHCHGGGNLHRGECDRSDHKIFENDEGDPYTDLSGMNLTFSDCGRCHDQAKAYHLRCTDENGCEKCHLDPSRHCETNYTYNGNKGDKVCDCCHDYPPQCVCVGISDTQDHCLESDPNGYLCDPGIYTCKRCHDFSGDPGHIREPYNPSAQLDGCLCHGASLGSVVGAHNKHLNSKVMADVYTDSNYTIDCRACHPSLADLDNHVVCDDTSFTADVVFDSTLEMIGTGDYFDRLTGTCYVYCHSDGDTPPNATGTYDYFSGIPPEWSQTTGLISCGNNTLSLSPDNIYQCHGYPPTPHPMPAISTECRFCHPTPVFWDINSNYDVTYHVNGAVEASPGGLGGGAGMPVP